MKTTEPLSHKQLLELTRQNLERAIQTHSDAQSDVIDFMIKAGQEVPDRPMMPSMDVRKLRARLIAEELIELCTAFNLELTVDGTTIELNELNVESDQTDMVEAYDATIDLMVVTVGTGVAIGTDLHPGWKEVHRSNMSKFIDGHRREDGKWVKGPSYSPAQLGPIIDSQLNQPSLL